MGLVISAGVVMSAGKYERTLEQKKAISDMFKAKWKDPEFRLKMSKRKYGMSMLGKSHSLETIEKLRKANIGKAAGKNNYFWKGGVVKRSNGYIHVHSPNHPLRNKDNYVYQHRLVMEKKIGRQLKGWEIVHHINGKKDDNRPENLELATHIENIQIDKLMRENAKLMKRVKELENS